MELDTESPPDWDSISSLTAIKYRLFAAENYQAQVKIMWNKIIANPEADNDELISSFLQWCESNSMLKLMFNTWIEGFTERNDGPVSHKEILQFINYLAMCEERHADRLMKEGLKP